MDEFMDFGIESSLLTVLPDYSKNFIPLQLKIALPSPLSKIFSSQLRGKPLSVLLKESEDLFSKYSVSNQQAEAIEILTRAQSKSELWNAFRIGRITASVVKSVITTSIANPSKSVLLKICYPNINSVNTPATKWGKDNEKKALKVWVKKLKSESLHTAFSIDDAGLTIYQSHPFLAASPDAIFNCPCHGRAVVEVKCPFKHANEKILTAARKDKDFCLYVTESEELALKKNHSYYSQIQFQMMVCQVDACFFIVYTKDFAKTVILPELIGKFYTETRYVKKVNVANDQQLPPTSIDIPNEEQSVNNDPNRNLIPYLSLFNPLAAQRFMVLVLVMFTELMKPWLYVVHLHVVLKLITDLVY
ncbi:hypothetical protein DAPPUDRAFT_331416 [Daphnia pulex]|uniref:YqaJ viral recombinase domain-containing protein n=1 Tax=Daphnia pulex TaxID=6669 RepID=E9HMF3_DAPPU|nr:hypothetical protein DAPPUDRAFT_331416 [Daphnia pulex]|eukprot:EFX67064.1 hypothetical protein DAPPUDRAFT_331416 [Daphnia pulex]